jgi:hypothetical protein
MTAWNATKDAKGDSGLSVLEHVADASSRFVP